MLTAKRGFAAPKQLRSLYEEAFPQEERLPFFFFFLYCVFKATLTRFYFNNALCAFTVTVKTREALFLVFFAVKKECRGMGFGSKVIGYLKQKYNIPVVADVEDPDVPAANAEQRRRRVAFYQKNELSLTEKALDEYCGRLRLVSSDAALSEKTVAALCARASFLRWTYCPTKSPALSDEERIAATAKEILEKYKKNL